MYQQTFSKLQRRWNYGGLSPRSCNATRLRHFARWLDVELRARLLQPCGLHLKISHKLTFPSPALQPINLTKYWDHHWLTSYVILKLQLNSALPVSHPSLNGVPYVSSPQFMEAQGVLKVVGLKTDGCCCFHIQFFSPSSSSFVAYFTAQLYACRLSNFPSFYTPFFPSLHSVRGHHL